MVTANVIHALIIEDDPYACDIMMMLLARDFRTRVVGELSCRNSLAVFESISSLINSNKAAPEKSLLECYNIDANQTIQTIILDTEVPLDQELPLKILEKISGWSSPPQVICTCTYPDQETLRKIAQFDCVVGYLVKGEILYSLASAVCLAANGYGLITPKILPLTFDGFKSTSQTLVICAHKGGQKIRESGKVKKDISRLNLIFNLSQYEIHDELNTTQKYVAQVISDNYSDLHIPEMVTGEIPFESLLANQFLDNSRIFEHYTKVLEDVTFADENNKRPKLKNMGTLAFHLITHPDIRQILVHR